MPMQLIPKEQLSPLIDRMTDLFQSDPDPAVHSAAEWALRSWEQSELLTSLKLKLAKTEPAESDRWYINQHELTMVIFRGPITVEVGSPPNEPNRDSSDESIVDKEINRSFAISTTEVSLKQYLEYLPNYQHRKNPYSPEPDCPVNSLTWHRSAEYCNWLTDQELTSDQRCFYASDDEMIAAVDCLSRTGYRLPTESEWEYACRAGTSTAFSWGNDEQMADRYAWLASNSKGRQWPVGTRCPNLCGLFDMHGSVSEWMQDVYEVQRSSGPDVESPPIFAEDSARVTRGGSAGGFVQFTRVANRTPVGAKSGVSVHCGFRIARTLR
jgi:formylglycine-generating enzyme required for sulfatase activity